MGGFFETTTVNGSIMESYEALLQKQEELAEQIEAARKREMVEAVAKVRELAEKYKLTPDDMQALGTFYASRPAYKQDSSNPLLAGAGRYIYEAGNPYSGVPACSACHGVTGEGATALPRLAGQFASYLESQLKQFNKRERTSDNEVMHVVAEKMTELEMAAVAEYLSGQ